MLLDKGLGGGIIKMKAKRRKDEESPLAYL